jgi:ribosomal protein S18 acetylase RimI-like enzyme
MQDALQCETAVPWEYGTVYRTLSVPDFWDANFVRVERGPLGGAEIAAFADSLLADCRHRKVEVVDSSLGVQVRSWFDAAGWMNERLVMMRRAGPLLPVGHDVVEVPVSSTRALRAQWYTDYEGDYEHQLAFARTQEPALERRGTRAFVVDEVGFATLAVGPGAVEIDQLYVTPSARGRGVGASLIGAALAAGGQDVAWVVADDEGRARSLYERLGFVSVWRFFSFVLVPTG